MTSRRPMTRSFSGNGRSSSINAEDEMSFSNGRSESRNPYLSNVRPENSYSSQRYTGSHYRSSRSTLCSVMAQLTDDIQPTFDITLKSKAVSEACNVKFTCVVSGYPVPELTWYKDDMEMDRYCGLPKYEIGRNGKTHTLHIYNCTVDDAAIYQASACNSKGIVSCSGVLEVGTMSEYKIHQRFFANLKQKADKKKRELEDSRRRGKENVRSSPDRTQRKRRSPEEVEPPTAPRVPQEESQVADVVERPAAVSFEANGVSAEACKKDVSQSLDLEVETKNSAIETLAKKKSKVSNGIDSGTFSSNHTVQGNGGENSYDGGLSFSQFLAGALHSQVAEEKQNLARLEKTVQVDDSSADVDMEKESAVEKEKQEKERALAEEQERRRIKERDLEMEKQREKERECARQREMLQRTTQETPSRAKTETKAHKQSDHHNIQASLTSVLHSVKDFFFGKSKKGHSRDEESSEEKERDFPVAPKQPYPSPPPHRPQELFVKPEVYEPPKEEAVPLEVNESQKASRIVRSDTQPLSLEPLTPDGYNHMMISPHTEDEPTTFEIALEDMSGSEEKNIVDMCLEVGGERPQNVSLSVLQNSIEVVNTNYQRVPVTEVVVPNPHEVNSPVMSPELDPQMERGETLAAPKQDLCEYTPSPESTQESGWHMSNPTTVALSGTLTECSVFITDSHGTIETDSHGTIKTDSHGTIETDSHGTIETDSHGTIETDSHGTIETDSHGTIKTDSHRTIETDSHGTIKTDSHRTIETDSHGTIDTDSHRTIETDSHGTIETDSHGTIETDSHETIETDSHGTIETDSHVTIDTDSHGTIETDSHRTIETDSHGTIDTDSHGTIDTDSHGTIETDSHGTIETDSHETIETDSHGTIETDSHVTIDTDSHGTIETDSHGTIETDSHGTIETDSHGTIETDSHETIETDSHGTIETDSHGTIETDSHGTIEIDKAQEIHVDVNNIVSDYEIRENHSQSTQNEGENFMEEIQPWPHIEDNIQTIDSETPALIDREPVVESIEPEQRPLILGENMLIKSQTNESIIVSQNYPEETPVFKECAGNGDYNFIEDAAPVLRESEEETILKAETQEPMVPETEKKASELDVKNVNIQGMYEILAFKNEKMVESEELEGQTTLDVQYKSSNHLETQSERDYVSMHEEISLSSSVIRPVDNTSHLGALTENVPDIRIFDSVIEDQSEFKQNENIAVTPIEIVKSEVGEPVPSKPLSVTELESEHDICQSKEERDASEKAVKTTATLSVSPTEEGMQDNYRFPAAKNIEEVVQQDETTLMGKKPNNLHNASLSVMNQWIPTINISCTDGFNLTDDDHDSLAKPSAFDGTLPYEAPKSSLFVVPPISVSVCEDSPGEAKLPPTFENTECLSLVEMLRGIESSLEKITTVDTDKLVGGQKQDTETEKERNDIPSVYNETAEVVSITPSLSKALDSVSVTALDKIKPNRETKTEPEIDRLGFKNPTPPLMSPASMRRFLARAAPTTDSPGGVSIPAITVGDSTQSDKTGEELSGGSTPTSSLSCESSPRLKRRDSLSQIRSATPEELASGARRKIFIPKTQGVEGESAVLGPGVLDVQCKKETPYMSPSQARRAAFLQASTGSQTPPLEKRSPLLARRKTTLDVPRVLEESTVELENPANETKPLEKEKPDPFKAPQVIRKIRGELFTDVSGHLKLWCQFFNVLSDSTIKWYRDEEEIVEVQRSGGDESQVALAIVQASSRDCGVYGCTIKNEYGTDSTDFLLSVDILSELLLRDETEVGEEIEMTPLTFSRGLVDSGHWGDKFFGRIMTEEAHLGEGCKHKASRVKVIYGLDPVFESGSTCIIKVQNPIAYGTKEESNLMERNLEITKQECRIQNMVREYCKIFAAEARVIENFGFALEVIPQYLMYRPANSVPYATVEADINGVYLRYCLMDAKGRLIMRTISEVEQKCCTFQHWIHQWTHGNLLVTRLEGVEMKITNVRVATKSKGYQGLTDIGSPNIFEQFLTLHQCNYYCGLLGLRSLKVTDSLQQPPKIKSSRSPLLNRKLGQNSSPQTQRKGLGSPQLVKKSTSSPQTVRKTNSSPKVVRKTEETEDKSKTVEVSKDVTIR